MEAQQTKVICGVYGPRQKSKMEFSETGKLQCEYKHVTFSSTGNRKKYLQDKEEKDFSTLIQQSLEGSVILERYPKSVIDIYILVLESDGGNPKKC
jgi:exosome complex component MTR3